MKGGRCCGYMLREEPLLWWNGTNWPRCGMGVSGVLKNVSVLCTTSFCNGILVLQSIHQRRREKLWLQR